jgi:hypothetical protein
MSIRPLIMTPLPLLSTSSLSKVAAAMAGNLAGAAAATEAAVVAVGMVVGEATTT